MVTIKTSMRFKLLRFAIILIIISVSLFVLCGCKKNKDPEVPLNDQTQNAETDVQAQPPLPGWY